MFDWLYDYRWDQLINPVLQLSPDSFHLLFAKGLAWNVLIDRFVSLLLSEMYQSIWTVLPRYFLGVSLITLLLLFT
jgi:hypothetical protein